MPPKDLKPTVIFNDFHGGDLGLARPAENDTTKFRALNVWRYDNGIGPRQPVIPFAVASNYTKAIQLFDYMPGDALGVVYKDKEYRVITSGTAVEPATAITNLPVDSCSVGGVQYYVSNSGTGATYDVIAGTITNSAIPQGRRILLHGVRLVVFPGPDATIPYPQSIRWSSPGPDAATWPVANFLQVSGSAGLADAWVQGNTLLLTDSAGIIYVVSGVLGLTDVLRTVNQVGPIRYGESPFYPQGGVAQLGSSWWRSGTHIIEYDGAQPYIRPGFERPSTTPSLDNAIPSQFMSMDTNGEFAWIMPGADSGASTAITVTMHHPDGGFTQHSIPVTSYTAEREPRVLGTYSRGLKTLALATGGSDTEAPLFYKWAPDASFPVTTDDGNSSDPVTASYRTSDWWAPVGTQVRVRNVTVDYSYKPAAVTGTDVQFDIAVEAVSQDDDFVVQTSTTQNFIPSTTVDGNPDFDLIQRGRKTFSMGEQGDGSGFRVKISNWRGMIIHQITVETSIEEYPR